MIKLCFAPSAFVRHPLAAAITVAAVMGGAIFDQGLLGLLIGAAGARLHRNNP